jgi:hypothetical protein
MDFWVFEQDVSAVEIPVKLYLGIGNIGTTIAAATVFYNAVSFHEPNMSSQKDVCHPVDRN